MSVILIIDDEPNHRLIYSEWINRLCPGRFTIVEASDAKEGYERIIKDDPVCVLLDYHMVGEDGFQMLNGLRRSPMLCPPVIFLSCALDESTKRNAIALGATACFEKTTMDGPMLVDAILDVIGREAA